VNATLVHGYRRGGFLMSVGQMFAVAYTGDLSCRSSLIRRAGITFPDGGITFPDGGIGLRTGGTMTRHFAIVET
jgi:hypothetical protein